MSFVKSALMFPYMAKQDATNSRCTTRDAGARTGEPAAHDMIPPNNMTPANCDNRADRRIAVILLST